MYGYVYIIKNKMNGKQYIGQTIQNPLRRKQHHFHELRNGIHNNSYLQHSFNKHGESSFTFSVITWARDIEGLNQLEIYFIEKYDCLNRDFGYNLKSGGNNGRHSDETKRKISESNKGLNKGLNKGRNCSEATRKKLSEANKGKILSEETRRKLSERMSGKNHPFYGKKQSKESLKKSSISHRKNKYPGATFRKGTDPEKKCWFTIISFNNKAKYLGTFIDPISASLIYKFVANEIFS